MLVFLCTYKHYHNCTATAVDDYYQETNAVYQASYYTCTMCATCESGTLPSRHWKVCFNLNPVLQCRHMTLYIVLLQL